MNIIAKILILVLVNCFLIARPASAHDEDTMLRLISPTTSAEEKVKILAKCFYEGYNDGLYEFAGLIRDGHEEALNDSLVRLFRSPDFSGETVAGVQWLSLFWIANLKLEDAYHAIIDDALKSNHDDLREEAFTAAATFDDRRPIVIKAILKELEQPPIFGRKTFDTATRIAAGYRLTEAIELISRHLSDEIIDDDLEESRDRRKNLLYKNWMAIGALNRFPRLPQSLIPKLETILENVERGIFHIDLNSAGNVRGLRTAVLEAFSKLPRFPESLIPTIETILVKAEKDLQKHDERFAKLTEDEKKNFSSSRFDAVKRLQMKALAVLSRIPKLPESLIPTIETILARSERYLQKHDPPFQVDIEADIELQTKALAAMAKIPRLPQSLIPTIETILARAERYLQKYDEMFDQLRYDDTIRFPHSEVYATIRLQRAAQKTLDKIQGSSPFRLYAFVIVLTCLAGLVILLKIKQRRTG